jgi:hypothetical protein
MAELDLLADVTDRPVAVGTLRALVAGTRLVRQEPGLA